MHQAASEGTMPPQMTFTGANFDIVTGATALIVALLAARGWAPRWLVLGWNALGSALLLTILAIAIASLPAFAAFGREPERLNTWVAYFPFVWFPPVSSASLFSATSCCGGGSCHVVCGDVLTPLFHKYFRRHPGPLAGQELAR